MQHHYFSRAAKVNWLTLERFAGLSSEDLLNGAFQINWDAEPPEVLAFRAHLENISADDLHELFGEQLAFRINDRAERRDAIDAGLFFNAPSAFADYGRWARQLTWTIEECIALSLGRRPDVLNLHAFNDADTNTRQSDLCQEFSARYKIAQNWIAVEQLTPVATPGEYLTWLDNVDLAFAPELTDAVIAFGNPIADWRSKSEALAEELSAVQLEKETALLQSQRWSSAYEGLRTEAENRIRVLESQILEAELALKLSDTQITEPTDTETLDPRERTSLHKMIFSMAKQKYRFDPIEDKWSAVARIESDIAASALSLSKKAIRGHLSNAANTAIQLIKK